MTTMVEDLSVGIHTQFYRAGIGFFEAIWSEIRVIKLNKWKSVFINMVLGCVSVVILVSGGVEINSAP
jgi:hypothetical protein